MSKVKQDTSAKAEFSKDVKLPKTVREGELHIAGKVIPCAVLDDGTRVLSQRQTLFALGRSKQSGVRHGDVTSSLLSSQNIQPYISKELRNAIENLIIYQPKTGRPANGLKVDFLPMICEAYITARQEDALLKGQMHIAKACQALQNGFARVGIVALVDEATGYQDIRATKTLAEILNRYLAKEIQKWTMTFPLEFYREIYRLRTDWEWEELENGKKPRTPSVVGKYTDDFVYQRLALPCYRNFVEETPGALSDTTNFLIPV